MKRPQKFHRFLKANPPSQEGGPLGLREYLAQPEIEERDPNEILEHLKSLSHKEVVPEMLAWYRSGDLWKVTMASTYFNHSDVSETIERLIHQVRCGNAKEASAARIHLAGYGEIALRKALKEMKGPNLQFLVRDVFSRMDGRLIPIALKSLRNEPLNVRMTVIRALAGRRSRNVLPVLLDLMREIKPTTRMGPLELDNTPLWGRSLATPILN